MPGSIKISDIQPPVTTPLFLEVAVGKREYSGNIGQDGFSFPVTSLRDSMVMTLYDADKELVSRTGVNTKAIVELGTMEVIFTLDSGGTIILELQFLLSDEDRKRVREMRSASMKRKQQELLENGHGLFLQDLPLPKEQTEEISDIGSKGDQLTLWKSMSVDDLKERDAFSVVSVTLPEEQTEEISDIASKAEQLRLRKSLSLDDLKESVDSDLTASKDQPLQSSGNTSKLENPVGIDYKKGHGKPESRLSSAVKNMISAFESSSPQGASSMPRIKSEGMPVSSEASTSFSTKAPTPGTSLNVQGATQIDPVAGTSRKVSLTSASAGTGSSSRTGKQVIIVSKKSNASRQTRVSNTSESRRRSSSRRDREAMTSAGESESIRAEKRSAEKHHRRPVSAYSPEQQQTNPSASITWIHPHLCITTASRQLRDLVDLEHLNATKNAAHNVREDVDKKLVEQSSSGDDMRSAAFSARQFPVVNGWLINQGVRAVIVIIACGAVFLNNR